MPADNLAPVPREPVLLVVSGPSGSGKDSLVDALRAAEPKLAYSVSATTRPSRPGEVEGQHYWFLERNEFERRRSAGEFLETRDYAGNLYGTPKKPIEDALAAGRDLVMKPEVNGAMAIKIVYPQAVLVFLTVPSAAILRERLEQRRTESPETIEERVAIAAREADAIGNYEYLIVNDDFDAALEKLRAVLIAERLKIARVRGRSALDGSS
ncbi:MAG TPA: guanylate kinase [Candidatus Eremiobacteraceae bacterium]|nr:guanylate kinase [Candidatus Eremiobacteraceae bacterium]